MNFELTQEQRALADSLGRYLSDRYGIAERHAVAGSPEGCSMAHWRAMAEIGAVGALFAPEAGGYAGTGTDIASVFEVLGRGLVVEPFLGALMSGTALAMSGDEAHLAMLARLVEGQEMLAFAHEEAHSRHAPEHLETTAVREGEGWVIDGAKAMVRQGAAASAFVVSAHTGGGDAQEKGGSSLFLVPAQAQGIGKQDFPAVDGGRVCELAFSHVRVPADALIGPAGDAAGIVERATGAGLLALSAEALGAMDMARDATLEYMRTRKQFKVPIGSFQALQHRMATLLLEVEQARSAVINAALAFDEAKPAARERALSAAKYSVGRIGTLVAEECIQIHGGMGMTWELPAAHYAKRLVMISHQLGDEDYHLERYVALGQA